MDTNGLTLKQRFNPSRFTRGEAPAGGSLELTQRRVFILPTMGGLAMVLTIVLLLLLAFVYNNNLVYMLGFLLAAVFFVGILHTFNSLAGLIVAAGDAQPVFAGEHAGFVLTVRNPGSQRRMAIDVKLESEISFSLEALESKSLTLYAAAPRRGWRLIDTVTFSSTYPLGIFRAWSPLRFDSRVLVYPEPSEISLPLPVGGGPQTSGVALVDRSGRDEFNGVREYRNGDSLRQIHWKAYAKGQGLLSKQYAAEAGGTQLWLDYDCTPGAHLEERLSRLCRWVIDAEQAGFSYGLMLPGYKIPPDNGQKHYAACMEALALF